MLIPKNIYSCKLQKGDLILMYIQPSHFQVKGFSEVVMKEILIIEKIIDNKVKWKHGTDLRIVLFFGELYMLKKQKPTHLSYV